MTYKYKAWTKTKNAVGGLLSATIGVILFFIVLYGMYWVTKNVSYSIFYEDMVKNTIVEMVKRDSLNLEKPK